jgi:hypothetical protein
MAIKVPAIGSEVEVTCYHDTSWMIYPTNPEFVIKGKVVRSEEWDKEDTFRVFTGKQDHAIAVIAMSSVVSIKTGDGKAVKYTKRQVTQAEPKIDTWEVTGSKGDIYTVTRSIKADGAAFWTCSCVGFQFKRNCSHIKGIQTKIKGE